MRRSLVVVLCWAAGAAPLAAQGWGDSAATALAARAVAVRARSQGDSAVRAWQVDARGVLLFLARLGAESGPTRLVRADQLDVEVYWRAPGRSKQVIRGWRDRRYLPNELQYHRDHLGIVTDGFGPRIRLGEGDEVRDIVHPLSAEGLARYEFARRDSVRVSAAGRVVTMDVLDVRPRDPALPAVVGTLYLDRASAELVRFRFSFTPASYRDPSVEQITVRLENALVDGRAWLPYHQSIEIIRNAGALDLPYRGIIRGDWSFGDYTLEPALPDTVFRGVPIAGLRAPGDSAGPWPVPFDSVLASADPAVSEGEAAAVRAEVARVMMGRSLSGLARSRWSVRGVSDLLRYDRVEGVALGMGGRLEGRGSGLSVAPTARVGLASGLVSGGITLAHRGAGARPWTVEVDAAREVRDLSDHPVVSGVVNSLGAQEWGQDHGDYVLVERAGIGVRHLVGDGTLLSWTAGWVDPGPLTVEVAPAHAEPRPQADLGGAPYWSTGLRLTSVPGGAAPGGAAGGWEVRLDGGWGRESSWGRGAVSYAAVAPLPAGTLALRTYGGAGTEALPGWRGFVLGGRGTLLGERYRAWGGRQMAWGELEWRFEVPAPAIPLGSFVSTGRRATLAPFVQAGWAGGAIAGGVGRPSDGVRGSAGLALELFYGLVRVEGGVGLATGRAQVTFDVGRAWWGVL